MLVKRLFPLLLALHLSASPQIWWVMLEQEPGSEVVKITSRAQERIRLRGQVDNPGQHPVSPAHMARIKDAGFRIRHASRFLNAVSVYVADPEQLSMLEDLPFVTTTRPVATAPHHRVPDSNPPLARSPVLDYGPATTQNDMLNIPLFHQRGYDGSGVLIAVFDTGFLLDHEVFDHLDLTAQYDFIDGEVNASGPGHEHGINVLSVLGGYAPDQLIGPAYQASYLLARTEDAYSESRVEEDNWVAALEWADSLGADIVSSSLNYFQDFDDPSEDYPLSALDGQTTITARAANIAASRGILVVNAAGNEGPGTSSLWPPADSPHVLAVGSINQIGSLSSFSGRGPTYDGRTKPDVVAQGSAVYMATSVNGYTYGNGTSFSTPQIAGLAALLLQANPTLHPDSVISIFQASGDRTNAPDNDYGWGLPDLTSHLPARESFSTRKCRVFPNPAGSGTVNMVFPEPLGTIPDQITAFDILGRELFIASITTTSGNQVQFSMPTHMVLTNQLIILSLRTADTQYVGKFIYLTS